LNSSFSVAWKNGRAKALHTAGGSLFKLAAVKITRVMCSYATLNKLPVVVLSNNTIKWRIQELSVDILKQTTAAGKRSGNLI